MFNLNSLDRKHYQLLSLESEMNMKWKLSRGTYILHSASWQANYIMIEEISHIGRLALFELNSLNHFAKYQAKHSSLFLYIRYIMASQVWSPACHWRWARPSRCFMTILTMTVTQPQSHSPSPLSPLSIGGTSSFNLYLKFYVSQINVQHDTSGLWMDSWQ